MIFNRIPFYILEEEPSTEELPKWTSGDGWALYGGVKLPVNPTDYPYMIIGYDKADERYELIASAGTYAYGTKTFPGDGVYTGFIANSSGGASVYSFDGTQWVFRYQTSGNAGGMLTAFTIEETVWANFDILNYPDYSETLYKADVYGQQYHPLDGYNVLEWDGNTNGLLSGTIAGRTHYRVSDPVLPDLNDFELSAVSSVEGVDFLVTEEIDGTLVSVDADCYVARDGLWRILSYWSVYSIDVYYAEKPMDGIPKAGLYFYKTETRKTIRLAYKNETIE